jgi:hypothetical protein
MARNREVGPVKIDVVKAHQENHSGDRGSDAGDADSNANRPTQATRVGATEFPSCRPGACLHTCEPSTSSALRVRRRREQCPAVPVAYSQHMLFQCAASGRRSFPLNDRRKPQTSPATAHHPYSAKGPSTGAGEWSGADLAMPIYDQRTGPGLARLFQNAHRTIWQIRRLHNSPADHRVNLHYPENGFKVHSVGRKSVPAPVASALRPPVPVSPSGLWLREPASNFIFRRPALAQIGRFNSFAPRRSSSPKTLSR